MTTNFATFSNRYILTKQNLMDIENEIVEETAACSISTQEEVNSNDHSDEEPSDLGLDAATATCTLQVVNSQY